MIVLTVCSNSRQASNWFAESTNQGSRMRPSRESIEVLAIRAGRCQEWAFVSAHVISLLRCRLREFLAKKLVMSSLITVTIKFRKKAQGLIFFEGSFWGAYLWRGLCSRGGGAYLRRENCVSQSIELALKLEGNLPFLLCFAMYLRTISNYNPPRAGGPYIWRGDLISFWNLTKTPSSRLSLFQSFTFVVLFLICYFSSFACSLVLSLLLFLNMIMSRNGRKRITWKERWIRGAQTRYVLFPVCFLA